jgi:AraC family transcriptional regulator of adaptative response/methylated-DNA-[protein]-cysteine methyltransferase
LAIIRKKEKPMRPADTITINEMSAPPETLHIADAESPFGLLLLGATEIGLSHLWLNEDGRALQRMRATFPRTQLVRQGSAHHAAAMSYFSQPRHAGYLAGISAAHRFRLRVWQRIARQCHWVKPRAINALAQAIGKPNAARAIGGAVGKNPVILYRAVPPRAGVMTAALAVIFGARK